VTATQSKSPTLAERLIAVQLALVAPKNRRNNFGNYNYRSAEDILEAVKPLLAEHGLLLTISDLVKEIGHSNYVEAVCSISIDGEGPFITTVAYARESDDRKGMDDSQITGSTSSYARKYALNGMFLIDDGRDSDDVAASSPPQQRQQQAPQQQRPPQQQQTLAQRAQQGRTPQQQQAPPPVDRSSQSGVTLITDKQMGFAERLVSEKGYDPDVVIPALVEKFSPVARIEEMARRDASKLIDFINSGDDFETFASSIDSSTYVPDIDEIPF